DAGGAGSAPRRQQGTRAPAGAPGAGQAAQGDHGALLGAARSASGGVTSAGVTSAAILPAQPFRRNTAVSRLRPRRRTRPSGSVSNSGPSRLRVSSLIRIWTGSPVG